MKRLLLTLSLLAAWGCDERVNHPGNVDRPKTCGNGRIDTGETCDPKIPTSSVGACLATCSDGIACTEDVKVGSPEACNVACSFLAISACRNDDGCCPMGCTGANDNDCSTMCGNSTVDAHETCDGNCPSGCEDNNRCTTKTAYGSAQTCSLSCGYQVISGCMNGDGCCPSGCTSANDGDCSATCGNNSVDNNETCDGNCPASCDDRNDCTLDIATGAAQTCSLACTHQRVTACRGGDGCCASGCTSATDSDCPSSCASVSACHGGDGCCPSGCTSSTDADCSAPSCTNVTSCTAGDGCCPSACTHSTDADCSPPDCSAATCSPSSDGCCPVDCPASTDPDCRPTPQGNVGDPCTSSCPGIPSNMYSPFCKTDWPGGYCSAHCTSGGCPAGSECAGPNYECIKVCTPTSPIECRFQDGYVCTSQFTPSEVHFSGCVKP